MKKSFQYKSVRRKNIHRVGTLPTCIVFELDNRDGISLSLKVRDLVREALEIEEDIALAGFAEARERTISGLKSLRHDEVW